MENLEQDFIDDEITNQEPVVEPDPEPAVILKDIVLDGDGGFDCQYLHKKFGWIAFTCPPKPRGEDSKRALWAYEDGRYEGEPAKKKEPESPSTEEIEILLSRAYSHPITGSDKHFAEALRKRAMGDESGASKAELSGMERVKEIKAMYKQ